MPKPAAAPSNQKNMRVRHSSAQRHSVSSAPKTSQLTGARLSLLVAISAVVTSSLAYLLWKNLKSDSNELEVLVPENEIRPQPQAAQEEARHTDAQKLDDGVGPLFHRHYALQIRGSRFTPEQLMERIQKDPNSCSPQAIARFEKTLGHPDRFEKGNEFYIHISGPWDGPVRVAETGDRSFVFITRHGHLEAGSIRFSISSDSSRNENGQLIFEIESWSRSRDGLVDLAFDKMRAGRFAQTQMWTKFCENVCELSGGEALGAVQITTEKAESQGMAN
jgi:hypothetical protein